MNTKIFTKNELSEAADIIRNGGIVAIPTETVYGLAANALDTEAVEKIFVAKGRQSDNPLIVHIANFSDWKKLVKEIPASAQMLAERFWPGPLTIILPKSDLVPDIVSGGLDTVAVRMPKNKVAFRFIKECGVPLAAPSANLSGAPSPTKFSHVLSDLNGKIDGIIDGGDCMVGVESTVISLAGKTPVILRPGRITVEQIEKVIGNVEVHYAATQALAENEAAASPGMKYKHYAPKADLTLIQGSEDAFVQYILKHADEKTAVICYDENQNALKQYNPFSLGMKEDSVTHAKRLFDILREIDRKGFTKAYAPLPEQTGVGLAVKNRLLRASGFHTIDLTQSNLHTGEKQTAVAIESDADKNKEAPELDEAVQPQPDVQADDAGADVNIIDMAAFEEDSAILALSDVKFEANFNEDFSREICDNITVIEKTQEDDPSKIYYEAVLDENGAVPAAYPVDDIGDDFQFDVYEDEEPKKRGFFSRLFGKKEEEEIEPEPFLPMRNPEWSADNALKKDAATRRIQDKSQDSVSGKLEKVEGIRVVGLTGKTGCGKTYLTKKLAAKTEHSVIIDADGLYHSMLKSDSMILSLVIAFGDGILDGKKVNRKKLAALAFSSEANLAKLNQTVLPLVAKEIVNLIRRAKANGAKCVFIDAPTLIESGLNQVCDEVIFITADPAIRQERIVKRDNITLDEIGQRMRFEKDDSFYVKYADRIIRNN